MLFLRYEGTVFDAPLESVWRFAGSGDRHSEAHLHRPTERKVRSDTPGPYSWEQPFDGEPVRFNVRGNAFPRVGIVYDVRKEEFIGSRFFLDTTPLGALTGFSGDGEFVPPTRADAQIGPAVARFFAQELDHDSAATKMSMSPGHRPAPLPPPGS